MPTVRSMLARAFAPLVRAVEGQPRQGPFPLSLSGGWLSADAGRYFNWWQLGYSPTGGDRSAVVERCVSLYAQTIASLPGSHFKADGHGGRTRVTNSALARIWHKPNDYQSISDFMLDAVRSLYLEGNCYGLALRNERFEVDEIHLMDARQSRPQVATSTGDVFYALGGNAVVARRLESLPGELRGQQLLVPARDVLHIKLSASRADPWPLLGEPPLVAALADVALSNAFAEQQMNFLRNQSRPSAVLSTDLTLDKDQIQALRDRWNEQSKSINQGGVPILSSGLKVSPWTTPARDAQIAELMRMSDEKICWAFGVPLQLLGLGSAPLSTTEALMELWLKSALGFAINHVEEAFDRLFDLKGWPDDYTELDTAALLRMNQKDRIEALARGTQSGIFSSNEARAFEDLPAVPFGDEPRTQAQNVPLSAAANIPSMPAAAVPPAAPAAKDYRADNFAAMQARAKTLSPRHGISASDGDAEPREPVIRKTRPNGLRPTF